MSSTISMEGQKLSRQQRRALARKGRKGGLTAGAALTLGAAALAGAPAQADPFLVANLADSGSGSLRDAIDLANANPGADTIAFKGGLTGTITLTTGQLVITDSVDIQGPGATALTVSGNNASRVFYLYNGAVTLDVTISGLTVTGGSATTGGGIADLDENLTLDGVTVTGNTASSEGGGVWGDGFSMNLTIRNSTISGNTAGNTGGGLYVEDTGGPLLVQSTVISGNQATGNGGGVYFYDPDDTVTFDRTTISGNTAGGAGGGVYLYDTDGGQVTFTQTTISGNSAQAGGGLFLYGPDDPVVIENSTISGNQATAGPGGGIFLYRGNYAFELRHSTVAGNTATGGGGGVFGYYGLITLDHALVADNTADDLGTSKGGAFDASFSLIENSGSATVNDNGGNVLGQDPQLGALGNHGGSTQTQVPAGTSPAVNAGDPAFVPPPSTDQRGGPRVVNGRIDIGAVEINPGTITLTTATASVAENAGTVTITATRTGGSDGAVSVTINTADGTAVAPGDYTAVAGGTLSWADGDTANRTLNVTIVNDTVPEPDETFSATLSSPTGGATLGAITTEVVTILSDPSDTLAIIAVPTLGDYGKLLLTALFGVGGVMLLRRKKGLAAPMLAVSLTLGAAGAAQAAPEGSRQAAILATLSTQGNTVTIRLADGTTYQIARERFKLVDSRKGRRGKPRPAEGTLPANQPIVLKVKNGKDGSLHRIRVELVDSAARATQVAGREGS